MAVHRRSAQLAIGDVAALGRSSALETECRARIIESMVLVESDNQRDARLDINNDV